MKIRLKLNRAFRLAERPPGDRRLWLLGAIALRRDDHAVPVWNFEIFWKRVLAWLAVLGLGGYLAAATALWFWLARVPENKVRWTTVATAPLRWSTFRTERGDTDVAVALRQLRDRNYGEAFFGLRAGLARAPANVEGRTTLAMMLAGGDPAQALATVEEGLQYAEDDPRLLQTLFGLYQFQGAHERARAQIVRLLARRPPLPPTAHAVVLAERATALAAAGDDAGVEALLAPLSATGDVRTDARIALLRLHALCRLGRPAEAEVLAAKFGVAASSVELVRAQAEAAIQQQDDAALERALRRLKGLAGDRPSTHYYVFQAWHRRKRLTLRDQAEREFYAAFGANDAALQGFGAVAVQLRLREVVGRARDVALAARLSPFAFNVHLTELALRNGDFDEAFRLLRDWENLVDTLAPVQRSYPELINRLTRATVAGGEQQIVALVSQLSSMRGRAGAPVYELIVTVLERAGNLDGARQVARLGNRFLPHTDALLAAEARLRPNVEVAAAVAAPPARAALSASVPGTADAALSQLDQLIAAENYTATRDLLRNLRTANPPWLAAADRVVALRELHLAVLTHDPFAARALVRAHLAKYRAHDEALGVLGLAKQLLAQRRLREARLLHDELSELTTKSPDMVAGLRSLGLEDDLASSAESAAAALAAIDRSLAKNQPAEALRIIDYVRKRAPQWVAATQAELQVREVRVRLSTDQRPAALSAFKEVLMRPGASRSAGFRLVRELLAEGEAERAQLLAREVVRLLPEDGAAQKLLKETEAPRPVE